MSGDTERLFVQLEGRIADFERKMAQAERRSTRTYTQLQTGSRRATRQMEHDMSRAAGRINTALASTTAAVGSFNSAISRLGGPIIGAAMFAGIIRGARQAVSEFSALGKAARDVSMDVEELQGIQRGFARGARISTDEVTRAFEFFNRAVGEAVMGSGPLNTIAERYGIALHNSNGELRTQGELLRVLADTIRGARTDQERAAIAQAAFGDVGRRMAQSLAGGADAIERMVAEAREAGHVIDRDLIQRAEEFDDRFDDLIRSAGTFFKTILFNSVDTVARLAEVRIAFEDLLRASEGRTRDMIGEGLSDALDEDGFRRAADAVGAYDRAIVQLRATAQATIGHLDAFADNLRLAGEADAADRLEAIGDTITEIIARFDDGTLSAGEFTDQMDAARGEAIVLVNALGDVDAQGFDHVRGAVLRLQDAMQAAIGTAHELAAAASAAVPEPGLARRAQDNAARDREDQLRRDREALAAFLTEQSRLAGRTRDQIALEAELRAVQRAAREEGIILTREQAEEQARLNIQLRGDAAPSGRSGGSGGGSTADAFAQAVEAIRQRTAALEAEAVALVAAAGSGREYGQALAYAYERARLLNAAQRDGLQITPELEAAIDSLADAYARAGDTAQTAAAQMQEMEANAQRGARAMASLFQGIMQGGDAARQALSQLLAQMAEAAFMRAVLGFGPTRSAATWLGGMLGFAGGGFTGSGPANQVAGVVHGGEYVFSKPAVDRIGVNRLEALHKGYRSGGHVAPARAMPAAGGDQRIKVEVGVSVDDDGALTAHVKRVVREDTPGIAIPIVRQGIEQFNKALPDRMAQIQRNPRRR